MIWGGASALPLFIVLGLGGMWAVIVYISPSYLFK
jgi:hypothetical protein